MKKLLFCLLCLLLLVPSEVWAAYARVAVVTAGGGTNSISVSTAATDMTGVDLIVIGVSWYNVNDPNPAVSDDSSNAYTLVGSIRTSGDFSSALYYKQAPTVDNSMVFSFTSTGIIVPSIVVMGFSGSTGTPLDQNTGSVGGSGTTVQPGSITPTQDDELLVSMSTILDAATVTVNLSFDSPPDQVNQVAGDHVGMAMTYQIQTTATARNPTFTYSASQTANITAGIASFKAAGGGGAVAKRGTLTGVLP